MAVFINTSASRLQQARAEGHKLGQEDQVRHTQRELQADIYKEADSRHRDMLITLRVSLSSFRTRPLPLGPFPICMDVFCFPVQISTDFSVILVNRNQKQKVLVGAKNLVNQPSLASVQFTEHIG